MPTTYHDMFEHVAHQTENSNLKKLMVIGDVDSRNMGRSSMHWTDVGDRDSSFGAGP